MNSRIPRIAAALLALGTAIGAQGALRSVPAAWSRPLFLVPSAHVLGHSLRNSSQKDLGTIRDMILDPASGEMRYAVLELSRFLGSGSEQRAIPWGFVIITPGEHDARKVEARTNLSEAEVRAAPQCTTGSAFDSELGRAIDAAFGKYEGRAHSDADASTFTRLSRMYGVALQGAEGRRVGQVTDIVLAPRNGCVAYLVLATTRDAGGHEVALPWSRMSLAPDAEQRLRATTPLSIERFVDAPLHDPADWERLSSRAWWSALSKHYASDPFWASARFAVVRELPSLRP